VRVRSSVVKIHGAALDLTGDASATRRREALVCTAAREKSFSTPFPMHGCGRCFVCESSRVKSSVRVFCLVTSGSKAHALYAERGADGDEQNEKTIKI
jgi:hypothetical protein